MAFNEKGASIKEIAEKLQLKNYTEQIDLADCYIKVRDINRPALQLTGFYDHFDSNRIQLIGMVEYAYLHSLQNEEERHEIYKKLFSYHIPAVIMCRDLKPEKNFIEEAQKAGTPVLGSPRATSQFEASLINLLGYYSTKTVNVFGYFCTKTINLFKIISCFFRDFIRRGGRASCGRPGLPPLHPLRIPSTGQGFILPIK